VPTDPAGNPDRESLPEAMAARLLERASELDAAGAAHNVDVSALRAAAREAGISPRAFDAALAEMREGEATGVTHARAHPRRRIWTSVAAGALLVATGAFYVAERTVPGPPSVARVPMIEEAYVLRCLSPQDAMALIRPHLTLRDNSVTVGKESLVMRIQATLAQQQQVKAVLDQYERAGSSSCAIDQGGAVRATPPSSEPTRR
jgi:hypothetical protein